VAGVTTAFLDDTLTLTVDTETTAVFHGPVEVCFSYDDTGLSEADEQALELLHHENDDWQDITTSIDMGFNIICGEVTEFSEFVIAFPTVTDFGIDGDVNGDDSVNAIDVQLVINAALGIDTIYSCDINGDGPVNAVDVQLVINAVLGIGILNDNAKVLTSPKAPHRMFPRAILIRIIVEA
jgi:hypothetical protein